MTSLTLRVNSKSITSRSGVFLCVRKLAIRFPTTLQVAAGHTLIFFQAARQSWTLIVSGSLHVTGTVTHEIWTCKRYISSRETYSSRGAPGSSARSLALTGLTFELHQPDKFIRHRLLPPRARHLRRGIV
jgi:hypothetical protein